MALTWQKRALPFVSKADEKKSTMMKPETKLALRTLFKKTALVGVLLAILTALCLYFIADPDTQFLVVVLAALATGGSSYYFASVAPLWVAMPWLKASLCVFAVLAGAASFAAVGAISVVGYVIATGEPSGGGSSGHFKSWD